MSKVLTIKDFPEEFILEQRMLMEPPAFDRWFGKVSGSTEPVYVPFKSVRFGPMRSPESPLIFDGINYARLWKAGAGISYVTQRMSGNTDDLYVRDLAKAMDGKRLAYKPFGDVVGIFNPTKEDYE